MIEKQIDTSSEEYRAECEAKTVALWPQWKRVDFYADVREKRGQEAADKLAQDVAAILAGQG